MDNDLHYKIIKPDKPLSDFVDSFWFLHNQSDSNKETTGLPDGRVDLFLFQSPAEPFRIVLLGLGIQQHEQAATQDTLKNTEIMHSETALEQMLVFFNH